MNYQMNSRPVQILLVEDNPGDVRLVQEALRDEKIINQVHVVNDGVEAMEFLRNQGPFQDAPRPDFILLDLNLPRMNGREVLQAIKSDDNLRLIPVIVLTSSQAEEDILRAYNCSANCFVTKPPDFESFIRVVRSIEDFWISIVKLPKGEYVDAEI
jgi:chemotaxis family two-component system response regulator Rcp1